jgi:hypothetical protein
MHPKVHVHVDVHETWTMKIDKEVDVVDTDLDVDMK